MYPGRRLTYVAEGRPPEEGDYTREERLLLAPRRRETGRTCRSCRWLSMRGQQRGCFPGGKYRKFLSSEEYDSGCSLHEMRE